MLNFFPISYTDSSAKSPNDDTEKKPRRSSSIFTWGKKSFITSKESLIKARSSSLIEPSSEVSVVKVNYSRPRTLSLVPDCCTSRKDISVDDVVTASYRIRDEIKLTPCEVYALPDNTVNRFSKRDAHAVTQNSRIFEICIRSV